jgi:hypothetical protein
MNQADVDNIVSELLSGPEPLQKYKLNAWYGPEILGDIVYTLKGGREAHYVKLVDKNGTIFYVMSRNYADGVDYDDDRDELTNIPDGYKLKKTIKHSGELKEKNLNTMKPAFRSELIIAFIIITSLIPIYIILFIK